MEINLSTTARNHRHSISSLSKTQYAQKPIFDLHYWEDTMTNADEEAYRRARKKVRHLRQFYKHLLTFSVVIVFLHILNVMTSSYYWAIWPTLGWGVGILLHGIQLFDFAPFFDADWEDRKIKQILAKNAGK